MFGKIKLGSRSLSSLKLDELNPRLIGYRKRGKIGTEKNIISTLVNHYDVMSLCRSILQNGFQPDEVLIAIPDDSGSSKRIVVEGNRRLSACKILKKPELLKGTNYEGQINRIKKHKNYLYVIDTIKKINIVELNNRASARSYIASKHTKESIKRWSVYTQGAYYIDLLNECSSVQELRGMINNTVSISRIKTVILFSRIADYIVDLNDLSLDEKALILEDIDNIKVEAILRLMQRSDFKEKIARVKIDDRGGMVLNGISHDAFDVILAKLARDSNFEKPLTTRQENSKEMQDYLLELESLISSFDKPDVYSDEPGTSEDIDLGLFSNEDDDSDDLLESNNDNNSTQPKPDDGNTKRIRVSYKLLNKKTLLITDYYKLNSLIEEAKKINCMTYKHASVLLSRTIIQVMLTIHIKSTELHDDYKKNAKHKYLELDSLLEYYISNTSKLIQDDVKLIKEAIKNFKNDGKNIANLATHSDKDILTELEVKHIQAKLQILADHFLKVFIDSKNEVLAV